MSSQGVSPAGALSTEVAVEGLLVHELLPLAMSVSVSVSVSVTVSV